MAGMSAIVERDGLVALPRSAHGVESRGSRGLDLGQPWAWARLARGGGISIIRG